MTAEIAILTRSAVVLAADSAVTVGGQRVYKSANKLFALSKDDPIGVMIYGNAEYFDVPWETVIKTFRREASGGWGTVKEAADELYGYLFEQRFQDRWFSEEDSVAEFAENLAHSYLELMRMRKIAPDAAEAVPFIWEQARASRQNTEQLDGMRNATVSSRIRPFVERGVEKCLKPYCRKRGCNVPPRLQRAIELATMALIFRTFASRSSTGIVVAGFGTDQLFPALCSYQIDGMLDGKLRVWGDNNLDLADKHESAAHVLAFAVADEVFLFMERIDSRYIQVLEELMKRQLEDYGADLVQALVPAADQNEARERALGLIADRVDKGLEAFARIRHMASAGRVVSVLRSLPKEELAAVAEALVELTSLQKRVSGELETVGGAVDVAVISRGDGLIWIKRKHYFDASKNTDFFMRQLSSLLGANGDAEDA